MYGKIPRLFIKDLLAHTDIVDLIDTRLKLKKQGKYYKACCPFHHDKNPSFTVNVERQFFYCFGCGSHGNAIDFLMKYDKLEFIESIEELAFKNGIELPYKNIYNSEFNKIYKRKKLYQLMENLSIFYNKMLKQKTFKYAQIYLKNRGLSKKIIEVFSIGFAPSKINDFINIFGKSNEKLILLKEASIILFNKTGCVYERFRERIIFPIRDIRGQVIAFGGRILGNGKPKYLNSPETLIFNKGRYLYGLYEAKKNKKYLYKLLVVEGYMDVVALAQFGIDYAVASLGTSTTSYHIELLYRTTDIVICCYDGDNAGRIAAWRTLEKTLPYLTDKRQLRFMFLPEGEDPDTLVRKIGKEEFEKLIEKSKPLSKFLFETLILQVDLSSKDGIFKLSALAIPLISKIPGETFKIYLLQKLGNKLGILDERKLENLLHKKEKKKPFTHQKFIKRTNMRILIGLLLQNPSLASIVPNLPVIEKLKLPGIAFFIELINFCKKYPGLKTSQVLEYYRENNVYTHLENLATWNHMIIEDMIEITFIELLTSIYDYILKKRQEALIARDRIYGLKTKERKELWLLNQELAKKN